MALDCHQAADNASDHRQNPNGAANILLIPDQTAENVVGSDRVKRAAYLVYQCAAGLPPQGKDRCKTYAPVNKGTIQCISLYRLGQQAILGQTDKRNHGEDLGHPQVERT